MNYLRLTTFLAENPNLGTTIYKCFYMDKPRILKLYTNNNFYEVMIYKILSGIPGIPVLIDYWLYNGIQYLIFEEYQPINLDSNKETFTLPDGTSLCVDAYLDMMLDTIDQMHKRGVIHCDIKFDNIMYDYENDRLVLIDFSNAEIFDPISWNPLFAIGDDIIPPHVKNSYFSIDLYELSLLFDLPELEDIPSYRRRADQILDNSSNLVCVSIGLDLSVSLYEADDYSVIDNFSYKDNVSFLSKNVMNNLSYYMHHIISFSNSLDNKSYTTDTSILKALNIIYKYIIQGNMPISYLFDVSKNLHRYMEEFPQESGDELLIATILLQLFRCSNDWNFVATVTKSDTLKCEFIINNIFRIYQKSYDSMLISMCDIPREVLIEYKDFLLNNGYKPINLLYNF